MILCTNLQTLYRFKTSAKQAKLLLSYRKFMKTSLESCDSKFAPWLGNCYNQLQKCWDTLTKKQPVLLQIAPTPPFKDIKIRGQNNNRKANIRVQNCMWKKKFNDLLFKQVPFLNQQATFISALIILWRAIFLSQLAFLVGGETSAPGQHRLGV